MLGGGQSLLGFGQSGEFGFPPGLQGARDQPVLRLHLGEGAFGAVGFVAGAFDGEFGGPAEALVPIGDLISGGQGEGDLGGIERLQEPAGDGGVHGGRGDGSAGWGGEPIGAAGALIGGLLPRAIGGAHWLAARAAGDDPLTQR